MAEEMFPILNDKYIKAIPWAFIAPHEKQAQENHSQSLKTLARRGGLDVIEAECAILGIKVQWGGGPISALEMARARANLMKHLWLWTKENEGAKAAKVA